MIDSAERKRRKEEKERRRKKRRSASRAEARFQHERSSRVNGAARSRSNSSTFDDTSIT